MKLRIGNIAVDVEEVDGVAQIKGVWAEEIKHPDGRQDVVVHVPCMKLAAKENK